MKKRQLVMILLVLLICLVSLSGAVSAGERENRKGVTLKFEALGEAEWAKVDIAKMKSKNVLQGYPDGKFRPNQPVSRIEAVVTAVRLMGLEEEAKAVLSSTQLHFKDADVIDKKYPWAKGYIVTALKNGLFDVAEEKIQPDKPASRLWVSSLLVRSLGMQSEALNRMVNIPDFKDAHQIPAGSLGYINVAVEYGIISGYPDGNFQPYKNVTRAELAALLVRTDGQLPDSNERVIVTGIITDVSFLTASVNEAVYGDGTITIQINEDTFQTFLISSDLRVNYQQRFIRAEHLQTKDMVSLTAEDGFVLEAVLLDRPEEIIETPVGGISEFKLKLKLEDDWEYNLEYENKNGEIEGEIEQETAYGKEKLEGERAVTALEDFLEELALTPDMSEEVIVEKVLAALDLNQGEFTKLELEIQFFNGQKVEFKMQIEDPDILPDDQQTAIRKFELEIALTGEEKIKFEYKNEKKNTEAQVEIKTSFGKEKYKGKDAVGFMENLLAELALTDQMNKQEMFERIVSVLEIETPQLKEFEVKVEFFKGSELEFEIENEFDDEDDD